MPNTHELQDDGCRVDGTRQSSRKHSLVPSYKLQARKWVRKECNDDRVHTDISTLKMVLMSEDLPEPGCNETSLLASRACVIHNTHLTHNENSEPANDDTAVIKTVSTASDHAPKVVGK